MNSLRREKQHILQHEKNIQTRDVFSRRVFNQANDQKQLQKQLQKRLQGGARRQRGRASGRQTGTANMTEQQRRQQVAAVAAQQVAGRRPTTRRGRRNITSTNRRSDNDKQITLSRRNADAQGHLQRQDLSITDTDGRKTGGDVTCPGGNITTHVVSYCRHPSGRNNRAQFGVVKPRVITSAADWDAFVHYIRERTTSRWYLNNRPGDENPEPAEIVQINNGRHLIGRFRGRGGDHNYDHVRGRIVAGGARQKTGLTWRTETVGQGFEVFTRKLKKGGFQRWGNTDVQDQGNTGGYKPSSGRNSIGRSRQQRQENNR